MHIAIVAPEALPVPPLMGGSVEICIHAIARELAKEHQVTVIGRSHPRLPKLERDGAITYVRVPRAGKRSVYLENVLRVLKKSSFDWIQVDNRPRYAAAVKAALPQRKVALFLHSLTFVTSPMLTPERAAVLLAKPDLVIANSTSLFEELSQRYPACRKKLRKVWLGVDVERFRPPTIGERQMLRRKFKVNGSYTVLFVGRVIPRKGIPVLIRAMKKVRKQVPKAKLIVAGGGKPGYVKQLKRLAKRLGVPAVFTGLLSNRGIHRIYRTADCFACPSQKHEAFGLVNVEAMASGLPVVASKIGGIGEIVESGKNGFLVEKFRDPAEFASRLASIATELEQARRLGEQARSDAVAKFGWTATARKLAALYQSPAAGETQLRLLRVADDREELSPFAGIAFEDGDTPGMDVTPMEAPPEHAPVVPELLEEIVAGAGLLVPEQMVSADTAASFTQERHSEQDPQEGQRKERYRRYVHSKWAKTRVLQNDAAANVYVPATKRLTADSLHDMLLTHRMVYVKPDIGAFGNGVIRVEWHPNREQPYQFQLGLKQRSFDTLEELSRSLMYVTSKRPYLIQQGIYLLTYQKHRFDIRVMVQKTPDGSWESTGLIGRVADPRKVVTNVHNGGTLRPIETLMGSYVFGTRLKRFIQELRTLGVKSGRALEKRYPGLKEIGVDVAVDQNCRPWILEVNTAPDPYIFRKLKDKSVYRKVYRLWLLHQPKLRPKPLSQKLGLGQGQGKAMIARRRRR